jgi:ABC-type nitrate/sulfonate/bicarbonate transport system substrate-binding protein
MFCPQNMGDDIPRLNEMKATKERWEEMMRFVKFAFAAIAAVALIGASSARAEPVKIRMAWVVPIANWASILLEKKDLMTHLGKSYTLETIRFRGTPPMITALANNEVEVASLAYSSFPIAVVNAGLSDLQVIADEFQEGVPGYYTDKYWVRKDSGINKVEDLKGKVAGTNAGGSAVDVAIRAMLHKHGLQPNRDYTFLEGPLPAMPAMLLQKKVDLIPAVLPFALNPKLAAGAKPLFDQADAIGRTDMIIDCARKSFIDKNRAAMVDFMEDWLRVVHWYLDPKNHAAVAEIAHKITKAPANRFGWLFTKNDNYRDPNMMPDLKALQSNVDTVKDLGFVKARVDISKHNDLSLLKEAVARLKK